MKSKTSDDSRRIALTTLIWIVLVSTFVSALLGFVHSVIEIWLDLDNYALEHNTLIAAIRFETEYILRHTVSFAAIGCVAGIVGAIIFCAWRLSRFRIADASRTNRTE